jgi:hypothetical protein
MPATQRFAGRCGRAFLANKLIKANTQPLIRIADCSNRQTCRGSSGARNPRQGDDEFGASAWPVAGANLSTVERGDFAAQAQPQAFSVSTAAVAATEKSLEDIGQLLVIYSPAGVRNSQYDRPIV